jgi:outer membrane translocation and assembly module TamA
MSCDPVFVGGLNLVESSIELRYLPYRKMFGATAFVDVGATGLDANPLHDGVSLAVGLGARLRTWYVPVAIDVGYRVVDNTSIVTPSALDRLLVLFRIGEAF